MYLAFGLVQARAFLEVNLQAAGQGKAAAHDWRLQSTSASHELAAMPLSTELVLAV